MMKTYRILPGGVFAMPDGSRKTAGDEITLPSDVAAMHAASLQPLPAAEAPAAQAELLPATETHQE